MKLLCVVTFVIAILPCIIADWGDEEAQWQEEWRGCPESIERTRYLRKHENKCYTFHLEERVDYDTAADICASEAEGGILTKIPNWDMGSWFRGNIHFVYGSLEEQEHGIWIGLKYDDDEDAFVWADGSPLTYTNWADGQGPRGGFFARMRGLVVDEECVAMHTGTTEWWDYKCRNGMGIFNVNKGFICEFARVD